MIPPLEQEGLRWYEIAGIIIAGLLMIIVLVGGAMKDMNNQNTLQNLCNSKQGVFVNSNFYYCDILQDGVYVRYIATCSNDNCRLVLQGVSGK